MGAKFQQASVAECPVHYYADLWFSVEMMQF